MKHVCVNSLQGLFSSSAASSLNVYICPQDLLYVWTEPKLCIGGVNLPEKRTLPCEGVELWVRLGAGLGAFTAVLLVSLTCYFWKKNKRYNSCFLSKYFFLSIPFCLFYAAYLTSVLLLHLILIISFLLSLSSSSLLPSFLSSISPSILFFSCSCFFLHILYVLTVLVMALQQ